ncbi:non-ribosomal peptide synthetase [Saccharobesus litoralis]|nr:non-ribosomal peptide synthetase [Saccharobesus litoralis]
MNDSKKKNKALDIYGLSPLQAGMLFDHLHHSGNEDHITQGVLPIEGDINPDWLEQAWQVLVDRHDALRTVFVHNDIKKPKQVVVEFRTAKLNYIDLTTEELSAAETLQRCQAIYQVDLTTPFNFMKDMLLRMSLIKTAAQRYQLVITNHHIILDGWSLSILLDELIECYWAIQHNTKPELAPPVAFKHYIQWVTKANKTEALAEFKSMFAGYGAIAELPKLQQVQADLKQSNQEQTQGQTATKTASQSIEYQLASELSRQLEAKSQRLGITNNILIQAAWAILIQGLTGKTDVCVGNVVSGRNPDIKQVENMVGMMINTLPLRIQLDKYQDLQTLLEAMQAQAKILEKHSYIPLADVQAQQRANHLLFDHLLTFENYPIDASLFAGKYADLGFVITERDGLDQTSVDFNLTIFPGEQYQFLFDFNPALYAVDLVQSLGGALELILRIMVTAPQAQVNLLAGKVNDYFNSKQLIEKCENNSCENNSNNQVELDGFSVDLNKIQSLVNSIDGVITSETCLLDYQGKPQLCCFYLAGQELDVAALIQPYLPRYAVPKHIVEVDFIPYCQDGQTIDQAALVKILESTQTDLTQDQQVVLEQMHGLWCELLHRDSVDYNADFFELGGHSIMAMTLVNLAKKQYSWRLNISDIFQNPTINNLVAKLTTKAQEKASVNSSNIFASLPIIKADNLAFYPTSSQQQRLYSLQALEPQSTAYNMPDVFEINGYIDADKLQHAFELTIRKHKILRSCFTLQDGEIVQQIRPQINFVLPQRQVANDAQALSLLDDFIQPFDLNQDTLVRAQLVVTHDSSKTWLLLDMHHIVTDGASVELLIKDLAVAYQQGDLEPSELHYHDYCVWQKQPANQQVFARQQYYWLKQFKTGIPVLNLPYAQARRPVFQYQAAHYQTQFSDELGATIRQFCQQQQVTPAIFFMACYQALLSRYSAADEVVVGTPVTGRNHSDLSQIVGMLVNTLPIKTQLDASTNFVQYLNQVQQVMLAGFDNQNYPLETLINELDPPRDLSRNPLFDCMFVYELQAAQMQDLGQAKFTALDSHNPVAKFDLLLAITELDASTGFNLFIEYATPLFDAEAIKSFAQHLVNFVSQVIAQPQTLINQVKFLAENETKRLVAEFNPISQPLPFSDIVSQFNAVAAKFSHLPAVVYQEQSLTYAELDIASANVAKNLLANGVNKGDVVALIMGRSTNMIAAILGVVRAGAAYVPLGADYPQERIQVILNELNAERILYSSDVADAVSAYVDTCLCLDVAQLINSSPVDVELPAIKSDDLAYVIYTSGSTGKPKGIMIEHRSVVNLGLYFSSLFSAGDNITQFAPYTFDASAGEIFTTLLNGACLHVLPMSVIANPELYAEYLVERAIHFTALPPPYLANVDFSQAKDLKVLLAAGSSSNPEIIDKLKDQLVYVNAYGPTETTVVSTEWRSDRDLIASNCIGKPITNTQVYILNKANQLQPIGVEGEICIGGLGVARGYVNEPEKNASQFISDSFSDVLPQNKGLIYKTGDMGKWTADGNIIFLGRVDDQVKIRGFRIEISEVNFHLEQHKDISQAYVVAGQDAQGNAYLAGYYTLLAGAKVSNQQIRQFMLKQLPDYMVPAYLLELDAFPINRNGKVDKQALPDPQSVLAQQADLQVAAETVEQQVLVDAWQKVLNLQAISITDNFFSLGGDSIKAIQIAAHLNTLGYKLEVGLLFQFPTIEALAEHIELSHQAIDQQAVTGTYPFTPIQHWFSEQAFSQAHHWNQSALLSADNIELAAVEQAMQSILAHHDNLRAIPDFANQQMHIMPVEQCQLSVKLFELDATNDQDVNQQLETIGQQVHASLDFQRGPLMAVALIKSPEGASAVQDYLLISIHHILVDGVSWRILFDDFKQAYADVLANKAIQLPNKTHSMQYWAEQLKTYSLDSQARSELAYWRNVCNSKTTEPLFNPSDEQCEKQGAASTRGKLGDLANVTQQFAPEFTGTFISAAHQAFNTDANDLLLTALAAAVGKVSGVGHFLVNLEGHGREALGFAADISRTVGWFTSAYPVRLTTRNVEVANNNLSNDKRVIEHLLTTKESLRQIPNKGIGFGILRYLRALNSDSEFTTDSASNTPVNNGFYAELKAEPQISFNYLGEFNLDAEESGLQVSDKSTGFEMSAESEAICALNINGSIFNNQLSFSWDYDPTQVSQQWIDAVAEAFSTELQAIVALCCAQEQSLRTASDYSASGLDAYELDLIGQQYPQQQIEDIHNLTPMQAGMLYHYVLDASRGDYLIQNEVIIRGEVEVEHLKSAFQTINARHQALRTAVLHDGFKQPRQVILRERQMPFVFFDISDLSKQSQQDYIENFKLEDWTRGFNLATDNLTRVAVLKLKQQEYRLIMLSHHIMMDGWCIGAVFSELMELYQANTQHMAADLPQVYHYSDYLSWLAEQNQPAALNYWRKQLGDFAQVSHVPFIEHQTSEVIAKPIKDEIAKSNEDDYLVKQQVLRLAPEQTQQLEQWAATQGVTLNTVMQTLWALQLANYNASSDVVFANVISGRPTELIGADQTIGLFVNTIPLRVQLSADDSFVDTARAIQADFKQGEAKGFVGLNQIKDQASLPADWLDHIFVFENYPVGVVEDEADQALQIEMLGGKEQVNYDFNIVVVPGESLEVRYSYNGNRFSQQSIINIQSHLQQMLNRLLNAISEQTTLLCKDLQLLSHAQINELVSLNASHYDYPAGQSIVSLIAQQVVKTPNAIALHFADQQMTYQQLWQQAGDLAVELRAKLHVTPDAVIGLMTERCQQMMVSILGILRAGAAYLPLDPKLPDDRVSYMLSNADAIALITSRPMAAANIFNGQIFDIQRQIPSVGERLASLLPQVTPAQLAYVIYTSGSTGRPKGVMVEHQSIINRLQWMARSFALTEQDVFLQKTAFTFDVSVFELFVPFICGASLALPEVGAEKQPQALLQAVQKWQVSIIHFVPSMLNAFTQYMAQGLAHNAGQNAGQNGHLADDIQRATSSLKFMLCSGEALTVADKNLAFSVLPNVAIHNLYGPTEAAIEVTASQVYPEDTKVTIGKPIDNCHCFILDPLGRFVPHGVVGELCLGGIQVARGYINNPQLTAERFVELEQLAMRVYKTGDLVNFDANNEIVYSGRLDFQVKVRGFRIEIAEIEQVLQSHANVCSTLVKTIKLNDATQALVAYYTCNHPVDALVFNDELASMLAKQLPDYMVPSFFIKMDEMPLNISGKIDRKQLPDPLYQEPEREFVAPETETEQLILDTWLEVLNRDGIGVTDAFDQIGGHSINAIAIASKLSKQKDLPVSLVDIFQYPSVRQLAQLVDQRVAQGSCQVMPEQNQPLVSQSIDIDALFAETLTMFTHFNASICQTSSSVEQFALSAVQQKHLSLADRLSGGVLDLGYTPDSEALIKAVQFTVAEQQLLTSILVTDKADELQKASWHYYPTVLDSSGGESAMLQLGAQDSAKDIEKDRQPRIAVPYLDLANVTEQQKHSLLTRIAQYVGSELGKCFVQGYIAENSTAQDYNLPYYLLVVKMATGQHQLLFAADHLITDARSLDVIRARVQTLYGELANDKQLGVVTKSDPSRSTNKGKKQLSYFDYALDSSRLPEMVSASMHSFADKFAQAQNAWLTWVEQTRANPSSHLVPASQQVQFVVPLNEALIHNCAHDITHDIEHDAKQLKADDLSNDNGNGFTRALTLFSQFAKQLTGLDRLPITLVTDTRKYHDPAYYHVVGEFLDHVPSIFDCSQPLTEQLDLLQSHLAQSVGAGVNFFALQSASIVKQNPAWQQISQLLYAQNAANCLLRFNYQGQLPEMANYANDAVTSSLETEDSNTPNPSRQLGGLLCEVAQVDDELHISLETDLAINLDTFQQVIAGFCQHDEA